MFFQLNLLFYNVVSNIRVDISYGIFICNYNNIMFFVAKIEPYICIISFTDNFISIFICIVLHKEMLYVNDQIASRTKSNFSETQSFRVLNVAKHYQ